MIIRPINFEEEYPVVCGWWRRHHATVMPAAVFLPAQGFIAITGCHMIAASWLFVTPGTKGGLGLIEFTTTNPEAHGSIRVEAVNELYRHLEQVAADQGCGSLISFVTEKGGESKALSHLGWQHAGGVPHLMYGKALPCPSRS